MGKRPEGLIWKVEKEEAEITLLLSPDGVTVYGVWICNFFMEHLQIVTAGNYNAIANSPSLQAIKIYTDSSDSAVPWSVVC